LRLQTGSARINGEPAVKDVVALNPGDHIQLMPAAEGQLRWSDGSTVALADAASVAVGDELMVESGTVACSVKPRSATERFVVQTPHLQATVLGTAYVVRVLSSLSTVDVREGRVAVNAPAGDGEPRILTAMQSIAVTSSGTRQRLDPAGMRVLGVDRAAPDPWMDPVSLHVDTSARWRDLPLFQFAYHKPEEGGTGYGGIVWPVDLKAGERRFCVWLRPQSVQPEKPEYQVAKVRLLVMLQHTQYTVGEVAIERDDRDWVLLCGDLDAAHLFWQQPGTTQEPCRPQDIRQLMLRTEIGNMELQVTPPMIFKPLPPRQPAAD
jgi:hypothetical protein